ncbi:MAG TPA: DEAD/DEAH box helicase [Actinomycetaceae bacterium]|nr:DEAD/DEAH box helicase [Actinomycetaceae bacterium]
MPATPDRAGSDGPGARTARALDLILAEGSLDGRLLHVERMAPRPAVTADWPQWADADLVAGYRRLGVARPWRHQTEAADALHAGRHTVISTGTGSGKSLPAWLAAVSAIRSGDVTAATPHAGSISRYRRRPTTLYLAPTKALAQDQLASLTALLQAAHLSDVRVAAADGDTPFTERDWARDHADIVLSNPDFLHFTLLPQHARWARLLRGLTHIVVDELHAYRGVTGAHVALVLRRLLRLAWHAGARPTVLTMSATAAEPAQTAARLIGVSPDDVVAVTEDSSPSGARAIALWQGSTATRGEDAFAVVDDDPWAIPPPEDEPAPVAKTARRAATTEAAHLLADLVAIGTRTLAFVRSRASAEYVAGKAREDLAETFPTAVEKVGSYRGGYLPEERREIERQLREGEILGLASTNALELGIDVSGLDAVLIAGWPGSRASLWQQAGRSGRAGSDGVAVFIASDDPLDTYLVHHPDDVFGEPVEATMFDPSNPYVLGPHLCAAASELPITEDDFGLFGIKSPEILDALCRRQLLRRRPTGWYWNIAIGATPQSLTDLRGSGGGETQVVEALTGAVIGTVSAGNADTTVHPGAVYTHQGRVYVVEDLEEHVALVRHVDPGYRTRTRSESAVRILETERSATWEVASEGSDDTGVIPVTWGFGKVEVTAQVTGYDRLLPPAMEIVGHYGLAMEERILPTKAVWWTLPLDACRAAGLDGDILPGALHAAEHASIGLLPLLATCDRWDIGGLSIENHPDTGAPAVFVYDGYPGGAGFAERGFGVARRWLEATLDVVRTCPCDDGCPSCIQSPKCGTGNSPLHKRGAVALLRLVLGAP